MKIRTEKDVEILDQRIKNELGIDVRKYGDEKAVEKFISLLVFPAYVINWTVRPLLIAILLYILGYFLIDLAALDYVIYAILGLIFFVLIGIVGGVLFLSWKMKNDIIKVLEYSLGMMKGAVEDTHQLKGTVTKENRKEALGMLFKGIIHIVTIPTMGAVIDEKVPLIGFIMKWFMKKTLTLVSDRMKFNEEAIAQQLEQQGETPSLVRIYSKSVGGATKGLRRVLSAVFGIVQLPVFIIFFIQFWLMVLFILLIH